MNSLDWFERKLGDLARRGQSQGVSEPLEVRREILRDIGERVQAKGQGEYVFPYSGVVIHAFASDEEHSQKLQAVLEETSIETDISTELADRGCNVSSVDVSLEITMIPEGYDAAKPYRIEYLQAQNRLPEPPLPRPAARLIVREGASNLRVLEINRDLVYIGRLVDVLKQGTGLERRNDLAFESTETTVSRKHARVQYDPATGHFRVINDPASQFGTAVFREGRKIVCDSKRGIQLRSGDEIQLGKARVAFETD
jgi:hypothetical protein